MERAHALNHHAPFLLTHSLLASDSFAADARIIDISSFVEKRALLDPADPDVTGTSWRDRRYSQIRVYATSKLLSLLATSELARRLPAGMRAYSADPGMVKTGFNANAGGPMRLTASLFRPWSITPDQAFGQRCGSPQRHRHPSRTVVSSPGPSRRHRHDSRRTQRSRVPCTTGLPLGWARCGWVFPGCGSAS
ncbi:hypothetical protein [Kibdelosporangium phytohabitans]|uniref:hypothetical protein n=1 Tax=Kibdelosporangium phytohabitans TaxID=860235 RepID=UPI0019E70BEF|nr:hypothetical protein [Kibdelosporangium phytohabitans]MBE1470370.1 NAD(P)-dependent dehydrogenase (short-subunit alcohol dehydrogenase family) [Kibdelosporangium phytohabitans]